MLANTDAADGLVSRAAARQLGKPEREAGSVLSSAQRHTHFLDSRRLAKVSARSDFRFSDLRAGIVTVFLVLPPDRFSSYSRWLRLLVSQAIQELARSPQMAGQPPVLMLLDEFASLGRLRAGAASLWPHGRPRRPAMGHFAGPDPVESHLRDELRHLSCQLRSGASVRTGRS